MKKTIYLDNAATTKTDIEVVKAMLPYFSEKFGNASSQHRVGEVAKQALESSREIIANAINAKAEEIIFTSGGTESNNLALKGLFFQNKPLENAKNLQTNFCATKSKTVPSHRSGKQNFVGNHIITTKIEHDCILNSCKWLEKQGAQITYLNVNPDGLINLEEIKNAITDKTFLVSVIHGNNEIGTIQNLEKIGKICKEKNVLFHTDACQSFTKVPIDVKKQNLDLITLNSHKIHGPKGVGALYIKNGIKITPLLHGGGHENNLRSGTENVSGIVGFAKAVSIANAKDISQMTLLRDKLIQGLLDIKNVTLNGSKNNRLCNNINVSFNNIEGEAIGGFLEEAGIYTSTGSACQSNTLKFSHVLKALGLNALASNSSLRISISKYTTSAEVDYFLREIKQVVKQLRSISPLVN